MSSRQVQCNLGLLTFSHVPNLLFVTLDRSVGGQSNHTDLLEKVSLLLGKSEPFLGPGRMKNVSVVVADNVAVGKARYVAKDPVELVRHEVAQLAAVAVLVLYDLVPDILIEIL